MAKQRAEDEVKVKLNQTKWKKTSLAKQRVEDEVKVKLEQTNRKRLSLNKRRKEDPEKLKIDQNQWQAKHRRVMNKHDRLKEFREVTMYNAIFICTCCHQLMFHSNVRLYTENLKQEINKNKPGFTETCIEDNVETLIANIFEDGDGFSDLRIAL